MISKTLLRDGVLPCAFAFCSMALFALFSHGLSFVVTFVPSMIVALLCYFATSFRAAPEPARVLPVYLLALAAQFLHFAEEYTTGFPRRWPQEIFSAAPYSNNVFVVFNMIAYAVFTIGALGIYFRIKPLMLVVWFFTIMGVIVNSIQHPIYCVIVHGYFPGFYTSLLHLALGPILFKRLWNRAP